MTGTSAEAELAEQVGSYFADPLGFILFAYPWGQPGPLQRFDGPLAWQREFLQEWGSEIRARGFDGHTAVPPIMFSTVSGHGVGKSSVCAFIVNYIMSTRPYCKGVVTANTSPQLETKTWAEVAKWTTLLINAHWFKVTTGRGAMKMVHRDHPESWRCDGLAWRENKSEAFAGQHAATSTSFYIFDEASSIPNAIFSTAAGGMTDGEPMQFMFGNGTQASGYFYDSHHKHKARFRTRSIDSRTVEITNKAYLQSIVDANGEDSDTAKIRVRGLFPVTSYRQYIPTDRVKAARAALVVPTREPIIMGVDVARFGSAKSVIAFRRGRDARTIPWVRYEKMDLVSLGMQVQRLALQHKPARINVDGGGVGGGVIDTLRHLGVPNVNEVTFGARALDNRRYRNRGVECWGEMNAWLANEVAIPNEDDLEEQLIGRLHTYQGPDLLVLETKDAMEDRGLPSPDDADALALTFAIPTVPAYLQGNSSPIGVGVDYDPHTDAFTSPYNEDYIP